MVLPRLFYYYYFNMINTFADPPYLENWQRHWSLSIILILAIGNTFYWGW